MLKYSLLSGFILSCAGMIYNYMYLNNKMKMFLGEGIIVILFATTTFIISKKIKKLNGGISSFSDIFKQMAVITLIFSIVSAGFKQIYLFSIDEAHKIELHQNYVNSELASFEKPDVTPEELVVKEEKLVEEADLIYSGNSLLIILIDFIMETVFMLVLVVIFSLLFRKEEKKLSL